MVDDKRICSANDGRRTFSRAAASYGAKLVNQSGGFKTISSQRLMIGQIVFDGVEDTEQLSSDIGAS